MLRRDLQLKPTAGKHVRWICKCKCGVTRSVNSAMLISGNSQSCGCLQSEQVSKRNTIHGYYGTPTYDAWNSMIDRCSNKNLRTWKWYGARGISVCKRWNKFENFLKDMGEKLKGLTLDRINNDGNYERKNCRWADWSTQNKNRRDRSLWVFKNKKVE